jgi:uncharacterized membrane protein YhhN
MDQRMSIIILTALIVCSASLTIAGEYSERRTLVYLCKPLTILLVILVALVQRHPTTAFHQWMIVAGLLFSMAGDVFLMLPRDRFIAGLFSFLVAHICYIAAFSFDGGSAMPLWSAAPFLFYGGVMLWLLLPRLGKMKVPVIVYMLVISIMGWLALTRWLANAGQGSLLALSGALLFIVSDSILALNRFRGRVRFAQLLILGTYFAAQWLIALSI